MNLKRSIVVVPAAAGIAVFGGMAAAHAASVVAVGGDATPRAVAYTATTTGINFDTDYGVPMVCGASTAAGDINAGSSVPGSSIATIDSTTWNDCLAPTLFNTEFNVTQTSSWDLNASSDAVGGVAQGDITGIVDVEVRSVEPGACDFNVSGTVEGAFDSNTQEIQISDPNNEYPLEITDVSGCFGEVLDGDGAQFVGEYSVTTAGGAVTFQ